MKPIVDLHLHLDGSLRLRTMLDIAQREGVKLPAEDIDGLDRSLRCGRVRKSVEDYLTAFPITLSVMQSRYALERVTAELLEDCAKEGLKYVEIRFSPLLHTQCDMSAADAVEAALRGIERGMRHGIRANLILCSLRHFDPKDSQIIALLAHAYRNPRGGVVAVDLAGDDLNFEARDHGRHFRWAKERGLGVTIHAGEGGSSERIIDALTLFKADRIGHGVRAIDDPAVLSLLGTYGTTIEACLTSNVQTRAAKNIWTHPAHEFLKRGLKVTLNTDNRLLAGTNLDWEFRRALLYWDDLDMAGARQMQINAIEGAFAPFDWKLALLRGLDTP